MFGNILYLHLYTTRHKNKRVSNRVEGIVLDPPACIRVDTCIFVMNQNYHSVVYSFCVRQSVKTFGASHRISCVKLLVFYLKRIIRTVSGVRDAFGRSE